MSFIDNQDIQSFESIKLTDSNNTSIITTTKLNSIICLSENLISENFNSKTVEAMNVISKVNNTLLFTKNNIIMSDTTITSTPINLTIQLSKRVIDDTDESNIVYDDQITFTSDVNIPINRNTFLFLESENNSIYAINTNNIILKDNKYYYESALTENIVKSYLIQLGTETTNNIRFYKWDKDTIELINLLTDKLILKNSIGEVELSVTKNTDTDNIALNINSDVVIEGKVLKIDTELTTIGSNWIVFELDGEEDINRNYFGIKGELTNQDGVKKEYGIKVTNNGVFYHNSDDTAPTIPDYKREYVNIESTDVSKEGILVRKSPDLYKIMSPYEFYYGKYDELMKYNIKPYMRDHEVLSFNGTTIDIQLNLSEISLFDQQLPMYNYQNTLQLIVPTSSNVTIEFYINTTTNTIEQHNDIASDYSLYHQYRDNLIHIGTAYYSALNELISLRVRFLNSYRSVIWNFSIDTANNQININKKCLNDYNTIDKEYTYSCFTFDKTGLTTSTIEIKGYNNTTYNNKYTAPTGYMLYEVKIPHDFKHVKVINNFISSTSKDLTFYNGNKNIEKITYNNVSNIATLLIPTTLIPYLNIKNSTMLFLLEFR